MSSLDARFVQHLRQRAKDQSVHVCPLCKSRLTFADSDAFLQHVNEVHADEAEKKDPTSLQLWVESLQTRATIEACVETVLAVCEISVNYSIANQEEVQNLRWRLERDLPENLVLIGFVYRPQRMTFQEREIVIEILGVEEGVNKLKRRDLIPTTDRSNLERRHRDPGEIRAERPPNVTIVTSSCGTCRIQGWTRIPISEFQPLEATLTLKENFYHVSYSILPKFRPVKSVKGR
jgi:hypothetical protein